MASGKIKFEELENMILTMVHQKWNDRGSNTNSCEIGPAEGEEFEVNGEIYKLEFKGGKPTPVKVNKPHGQFKGSCYKCDRKGHTSKFCNYKLIS